MLGEQKKWFDFLLSYDLSVVLEFSFSSEKHDLSLFFWKVQWKSALFSETNQIGKEFPHLT